MPSCPVVGCLLLLAWQATASEQPKCAFAERTWGRLLYLGGAIGVPGDPATAHRKGSDWRNTLTVSCDSVKLLLRNSRTIEFAPRQITGVARGSRYLTEDRSSIGELILFGPVFGPLLALGERSKAHFIAIEYTLPDGRRTGVLLRTDKKNHEAIFSALETVTGLKSAKTP